MLLRTILSLARLPGLSDFVDSIPRRRLLVQFLTFALALQFFRFFLQGVGIRFWHWGSSVAGTPRTQGQQTDPTAEQNQEAPHR